MSPLFLTPYTPEREEELCFKLSCKGVSDALADKINREFALHAWRGDIVDINYKITFTYHRVVMRLELMEELLDLGMVASAETETLLQSRCLIQDLLTKLERIEGRLKKR